MKWCLFASILSVAVAAAPQGNQATTTIAIGESGPVNPCAALSATSEAYMSNHPKGSSHQKQLLFTIANNGL